MTPNSKGDSGDKVRSGRNVSTVHKALGSVSQHHKTVHVFSASTHSMAQQHRALERTVALGPAVTATAHSILLCISRLG